MLTTITTYTFQGYYLSSFSVSEASSSARLLMFPPGCPGCFLAISGVAATLEAEVGLRLATCLC